MDKYEVRNKTADSHGSHSFGGDLTFHCHIHVMVSAGGFEESSGRWISEVHLNTSALKRMWSYAVIYHLRQALKSGALKSDLSPQDTLRHLSNVYERHPRWIVLGEGVVSKANFVKYATRYLRRPPIATWRISKVIDGQVEFIAKDTKNDNDLVPTRCTLDHFVRLLASHVADHYLHGVRHFGLLAPRAKNKLLAGLFLLGQERRPRPRKVTWRESMKKCFGVDPMIDNFGQEMHWM